MIGGTAVDLDVAYTTNFGQWSGSPSNTTPPISPPTVSTLAATAIGSTSATLNAQVANAGGGTITQERFIWGTTPSCSDGSTVLTPNGTSFSYTPTDPTPGQTEYFEASAYNGASWGTGSVMPFTTASSGTAPEPPSTTAPVAGFDTSVYPGKSVMAWLRENTNLEWVGYYLSPAPSRSNSSWMGNLSTLENTQGWDVAPIYEGEQDPVNKPANDPNDPNSYDPGTDGDNGGPDGTATVQLLQQEGFSTGTTVYLAIETSGTQSSDELAYISAWCTAVRNGNYIPGIYCHGSTTQESIATMEPNAPYWIVKIPGPTPRSTTPFSTEDPSNSGVSGAIGWQYAQNTPIYVPTSSGSLNVDLDVVDATIPNLNGTSSSIAVSGPTLNLTGTAGSDSASVSFTDGAHGTATLNGLSQAFTVGNNSSDVNAIVVGGNAAGLSKSVYVDTGNSYTASQSLSGTTMVGPGGVEVNVTGAADSYVYGSPQSTATINVPNGIGNNYYVDAANGGYSYVADPISGIYSELDGFGAETVTGSGGTTYAYIYSASHAQIVASPSQTTITVNGVTSTLGGFSQVYIVGAADGTDSVTLDSSGGTFVATPGYSYVTGTSNGSSFFIGAINVANLTANSAGTTDTAVFYSYPGNTFDGTPGASSLSGSTTSLAGVAYAFAIQASGFGAVSVFESGSGTDVANLTSPGNGSFYSTDTADLLTVGSSTLTVNTYYIPSDGQTTAVPGVIVVTGAGNGTDTADIYDSPGNNALSASNSTATLTTSLGSLSINKFGSVTANQQNGTNDTLDEGTIDFALQTVGNWTSG